MGSATPIYALPYPVGSDRVMDGDNAIQALAERIEALLDTRPRGSVVHAQRTADSVPGLAVQSLGFTVTTVANRRYRLSSVSHAVMVAAAVTEHRLLVDGVQVQFAISVHSSAGQRNTATPWVEVAPAAGAHLFELTIAASTGNVTSSASPTYPTTLSLEDIGDATPGPALRDRLDGDRPGVDNDLPEHAEERESTR